MHTKTHSLQTQLNAGPILTDAGLETDLVFNQGIDLPCFAAFDLLSTDRGRETLAAYYRRYLDLARRFGAGFILESPTWRANSDWGGQLGYSTQDLEAVNGGAIEWLRQLRGEYSDLERVWLSGNIGPRGDGYTVTEAMTAAQAEDYHRHQITAFAAADADMVSALTLNYVDEALGIARAAAQQAVPVVLSFTLETDGRLPSGATLQNAIETVDAQTGAYPLYYMINCAHPTHFEPILRDAGDWTHRIRGIRSNASRCSHAELDVMETLDDGNPAELGDDYRRLQQLLPGLQVYGGCCGTDHRHIERIARACIAH